MQFKVVVPDFCGYNRELDSQRGSCDYVTSQNLPFRYPFECRFCSAKYTLCSYEELRSTKKPTSPKNVSVPLCSADFHTFSLIATVTAVFFICYLPYHIERLIVQYTKQQCNSSMFCLLLYPVTATVTAVFFICYLPYHIERLIVQYTKQQCNSSMFCLLLYPVTVLDESRCSRGTVCVNSVVSFASGPSLRYDRARIASALVFASSTRCVIPKL
ncbi:unnamed protein product [Cylicostephanus goldi]|uniref:Uncharacterized protein n=1 Tax=Cylicostephanus goldi TaxID=71465 RepID=A0A3P7N329_CYLGO|nr:unnamed protein product [Cylicostephanus goldi]